MAEPKSSTPNLGGNGLVLLLLAAAGTYFVTHQAPLEGNRPPTSETYIREQGRVQDVESRLWQDPFAAVAERLTKGELTPQKCKDDPNEELADHCRSPLSRHDGAPPIVVVASVSGAPYSEDHEFRRGVAIMFALWGILYAVFGNSPAPQGGRSAFGSIAR
jgi:hypothetical protein